MRNKVCVLGLGYIGLPTALLLADAGHYIIGVDTSDHVVSSLNNCKMTINEPGLDKLLQKAFKQKNLLLIINLLLLMFL